MPAPRSAEGRLQVTHPEPSWQRRGRRAGSRKGTGSIPRPQGLVRHRSSPSWVKPSLEAQDESRRQGLHGNAAQGEAVLGVWHLTPRTKDHS